MELTKLNDELLDKLVKETDLTLSKWAMRNPERKLSTPGSTKLYTYIQMAEEVGERTDVGLSLISDMCLLALDLYARNKTPKNK